MSFNTKMCVLVI